MRSEKKKKGVQRVPNFLRLQFVGYPFTSRLNFVC